jgi:choline dehydrogenase
LTDVVIVGGGTAGSVLSARLSEDGGRHVTLLEAGPDDASYDGRVRDPRRAIELFAETPHSEVCTMDAGAGSSIAMVRGLGLGGTSAVNYLVAMRGKSSDYDGWNLPGWSWAELEPYFDRAESTLGIRPWTRDQLSLAAEAFLEAVPGATVLSAALHPNGDRKTVSEAYLTPDVRARPNLEIRTNARVERLDDLVAPEIIVCCGATRTPPLLQRSGIECGDGLQDHLGIPITYQHPGPSRLGGSPAQVLLDDEDGHIIPTIVHDDGTATIVTLLLFLLDLDDRGAVHGDDVRAQQRDARDVDRLTALLDVAVAWESSDAFRRLHLERLGDLPDPLATPLLSYGHQASTCAMGAVLDEACRVRGAEHIRVVDASSLPTLPRATPYLTVVALAERVADMMNG